MDQPTERNPRPTNTPPRPAYHRRRRRSRLKTFKEAYLPPILAAVVIVLIVVFVSNSFARANRKKQAELEASIAASSSLQAEQERLEEQAAQLIAQAEILASAYDYEGALAVLDQFEGNMYDFPELSAKWAAYTDAQKSLVVWDDPGKIPNLSFQLLIADPQRAFTDAVYKNSFDRNFVTTEEFSKILTQLYENGYVLVSMDDIVTTDVTNTGITVYTPKKLMLPAGKKPIMITQTNVNYSLYLVDSDGDMVPDKGGSGFASKLVLDANGNVTCEMVDANGVTQTGAYDLVPILDAFVKAHPDFSYQGAKATLALTGYNGLFGYRTHLEGKSKLGADAYNQAVSDVQALAKALTDNGYTLAYYTYANIAYGTKSVADIRNELNRWQAEVEPIIGKVDTIVFAQNSDIATTTAYSGEKFNLLQSAGFRYYLGFCTEGNTWATLSDSYVRMGRLMVGGSTIRNNSAWFEGLFDSTTILNR